MAHFLVRSIEQPPRVLAQALALAIDSPDERVCIRDRERRVFELTRSFSE